MRRVLVMAAVLASLAMAGDWMAYTANSVTALPENLARPAEAIMPAGGMDFPNADTLKYDDNSPANARAKPDVGSGFGVRFIRPADSITLAGALIHLWNNTWPNPGGDRFMVAVYAADGVNGSPGTQLWVSETLTGTRGAWNYVPIGTAIRSSNFYIFYIQSDPYPSCPGLSLDSRRNSPDSIQWDDDQGTFRLATDRPIGDFLIRAVLDWTPQHHNFAALLFPFLPLDTTQNVNLALQVTFRNLGLDTVPRGVSVKARITGPEGYYREFNNDSVVAKVAPRGQTTVTFHPNWHLPDTVGQYVVKVWHEWPDEEYRPNDTMIRTLNAFRWRAYARWPTFVNLNWPSPMRATKFHPADFGLFYPVQVARVKSQYYWHPDYPWDDSIFQYAIFNDTGATLWMSDTLRASHLAIIDAKIDPPVIVDSGDFYLACVPRSAFGYPATTGDSFPQGHSFYGSPQIGWAPWTYGEFFFAFQTGAEARPQYDVGAASIVSPKGMVDTGQTIAPQVRVNNYGARRASFSVRLRIGDDYADSQYVSNLPPGDTLTVGFGDWTADSLGRLAVTCSTEFDLDMRPANDRLRDSILIRRPDVGVTRLIAPVANVDSGEVVTPQVMAANYGSALTTFPVWFRIRTRDRMLLTAGRSSSITRPATRPSLTSVGSLPGGKMRSAGSTVPTAAPAALSDEACAASFDKAQMLSVVYEDSVWCRLSPGESMAVSFPTWVASSNDTCFLEAFTDLPNDVNRGNDSVHGATFVRAPRHDVAVVRILGPVGQVKQDSTVTPQAEVSNLGSVPEDFQVRFRIGGTYNEVLNVSQLEPGLSDTLSFPAWEASTMGLFQVVCTTSRADENPGNNFRRDSVRVISAGVDEAGLPLRIPRDLVLQGASPNPFASRALLSYGLPVAEAVTLGIYSSSGVLVREFRTPVQVPGFYNLAWDGCDVRGQAAARGIYFCRLRAQDAELIAKLVKLE